MDSPAQRDKADNTINSNNNRLMVKCNLHRWVLDPTLNPVQVLVPGSMARIQPCSLLALHLLLHRVIRGRRVLFVYLLLKHPRQQRPSRLSPGMGSRCLLSPRIQATCWYLAV